MKFGQIQGVIRRRLLINFRVDAVTATRMVPAPFTPKFHDGSAIAGICLIRLEQVRPGGLPRWLGFSSENAAHRIAVLWNDGDGTQREGVYIPRRDSNFWFSQLAGGRLFPGEQHRADFKVTDDGAAVSLSARSRDGAMTLSVEGCSSDTFPSNSCFDSLASSSAFFEAGSVGYSATARCDRFDGIQLATSRWEVRPFELKHVESSLFDDESVFPRGSVEFDHALVMRDLEHCWLSQPDLVAAIDSSSSRGSFWKRHP